MNLFVFRFQDSPLLDGISVHESWGHVIILVPTVASVHRLCFPHPTKMAKESSHTEEDGRIILFFMTYLVYLNSFN